MQRARKLTNASCLADQYVAPAAPPSVAVTPATRPAVVKPDAGLKLLQEAARMGRNLSIFFAQTFALAVNHEKTPSLTTGKCECVVAYALTPWV